MNKLTKPNLKRCSHSDDTDKDQLHMRTMYGRVKKVARVIASKAVKLYLDSSARAGGAGLFA